MKATIKHSILAFLLATGLVSCSDFLDVIPDNVPTLDHAFSDRYTAEKYLFTCYSFLPDYSATNDNPALVGGDEIWYPEVDWLAGNPGFRYAKGEQNISNPIFDEWEPLYQGIRCCNTFLEEIHGVEDLYAFERDKWIAEVNFLKAYYHFYLIRMYGPIHIVDENLPVSASIDQIKLERDPVDACFDYVVDLLDEAIEDLPLQIEEPNAELGRITKPIAAALKAKVLMTAASPLFNGNNDYATFTSKTGVQFFNPDYVASKWDSAASACLQAIEIAEEAGFGLYQFEDYLNVMQNNDSLATKLFLRSRITERWNKEVIWGTTSAIVDYLQYEATPRFYPCTSNPVASRHAPTLRIVEQYYTKNGVPIDEDVDWDYAGRYTVAKSSIDHKYYIALGEETAALHYDRESRFYSDISHDRGLWFGNGKLIDDEDSWIIKNRKGEYSSIFEISQYSVTGYYPKKLIHLDNELRDGTQYIRTSYAFPLIRMAELYLSYAEALNEIKATPDEEVYAYIDAVRNRAMLEGVVDSWSAHSVNPQKPLSKGGMRDIIHQERMIELSFEGSRFWDLRRWKMASSVMNKPIQGWSVYGSDAKEYYRLKNLFTQSFTLRDYLWPLREDEIVKNPNLTQNPGW